MSKIAVKIDYIFNWSNGYSRALILQTHDNQISFPIIIADFEAICLLKELEKIKVKRPQTHDLFFSFMQTFDIHVEEIFIHGLKDGIFHTKLVCSTQEKKFELDARPSDAIILALKAKAPIFVDDKILEKFGTSTIEMEKKKFLSGNDNQNTNVSRNEKYVFENNPNENLENLLERAIRTEDFEIAAQIRDILKERKI
jgi:bifunctional DNase/RNase